MVSATRWALINYAHRWEAANLHVWLETDRPCHLWLRFTSHTERLHRHEAADRGYNWIKDPKYCFVQWQEVEQNEPGDTVQHTFTFAGWGVCERRWWHFRGEIAGQPSPSNTAIVTAHYQDQEKAMPFKHTDLIEKELAGIIDHADDSITAPKLAHNINAQPIGFNADKVDGKHAAELGIPMQSFSIMKVAAQMIPTGVTAKVFWDNAAQWDDWAGWDPVNNRINLPANSLFLVTLKVTWDGFPFASWFKLYLYRGVGLHRAYYRSCGLPAVYESEDITCLIKTTAATFLEVWVRHDIGGVEWIVGGGIFNHWDVVKLA